MAGELPTQEETPYEKLLEQLAKHLWLTMYRGSGYKREKPWEQLDTGNQRIYYDWAMNAIGKMLGPGEWKRIKMSNTEGRVTFVRTDT